MNMSDYKTYSNDILLNDELYSGMDRNEMGSNILKMLRAIDFSVYKVNVDVLYLANPDLKNTIKVRVFRRLKSKK